MNSFENFWLTLAISALHSITGNHIKLSAVHDIPYLEHLYHRKRDENPPSPRDPATNDPNIRQLICDDITSSGFFEWYVLDPVSSSEALTRLQEPQYSHFLRRIYSQSADDESKYEYSNYYAEEELEVLSTANGNIYKTNEQVFVCLLQERLSKNLVPFYVSKEYDINIEPKGKYKAGRFVFGERRFVILAEESAEIVPNIDVERHYLQMQRDHQPAENFEQDPVCRLVTKEARDNQHYRLCVIVLTSPHFKDIFRYPTRVNAYSVLEEQISFKTEDPEEQATKTDYQEKLVICPVRIVGSSDQTRVYISRAYKSEEVFVYLRDSDGKLYLQNLARNVGIVHEPSVRNFNTSNIELRWKF